MLGVGSMGAMMALLMAEHEYEVHFYDPSKETPCGIAGHHLTSATGEKNMDTLQQQAKDIHLSERVQRCQSYEDV
jgi:3-hydroxyacyl-CoA dehydrogenase